VTGWPEEAVRRHRAAGHWGEESFGAMLRRQAAEHGSRIALIAGNTTRSYAELDQRVDALAAGLAALGIAAGDAVVLQLPNGITFIETCFALFRLGARPIMALPAHRLNELRGFCDHAGAVAYIAADIHPGCDYRDLARLLRSQCTSLQHVIIAGDAAEFIALDRLYQAPMRRPEPSAREIACFQLSGGTTGVPKLIPRHHDEYLYNVRCCLEVCGMDAESTYLVVLPVAHNFPLCCPGVMGTLMAGGRVVLAPTPQPVECFTLIAQHEVTITALVPPLAMLWLDAAVKERPNLASLRLLQVGGARLAAEAARRVRPLLGCQLQQVFGMAEGLICMTRPDDPDAVIVNTQGRPVSPDDEIRILDDAGRPARSGLLLARGPYTIRGYWRRPEENARSFTDDGFYRTGDRVSLDETGNLTVEGRDKDQINRGGEKISAEEIEGFLLGHPAVLDVAIVGLPDPVLGERLCAFVIPRGQAPKPAVLREHLRAQGVAAFKLPDRFTFVDAFPQTGVGKINRKDLREALRTTHAPAVRAAE